MEHERFDQHGDERTAVTGAGMVLPPSGDPGIDVPADHNFNDGPRLGWDRQNFGPADYVGDEETQDYPEVADGSQLDGPDDA